MVLMKPDPLRKQKVQARAYQPSLNPVKSQEACEFKSTDNSFVFPSFLMWVGVSRDPQISMGKESSCMSESEDINKRLCVTEDGEGILIHLCCYIKVAWKKVICYQNGCPPPAGMKTASPGVKPVLVLTCTLAC